MTDNSNRSDPAEKDYTLSLFDKEIEKELSLISILRYAQNVDKITVSIIVLKM
jgi:hypothetical protein